MKLLEARTIIKGGVKGIVCRLPRSLVGKIRTVKDESGNYLFDRREDGLLYFEVDRLPYIWKEITELEYIADVMFGTMDRMKKQYKKCIKEALKAEDTERVKLLESEICDMLCLMGKN